MRVIAPLGIKLGTMSSLCFINKADFTQSLISISIRYLRQFKVFETIGLVFSIKI